MKRNTTILILFLFLININNLFAQEKTGFAIDPSAKNIAALFTMTDENGRIRNLELMESIFEDKTLGFSCERHHNVPSTYIYEKLTELASNLEDNATLLLYFNSHGGGSGNRFAMSAKEGSFKFDKALEYLGKSNKKIKRLIFLVDTCHAEGSIQNSLQVNGDLLRSIQTAKPTDFLPELKDNYDRNQLPFTAIFLNYINKSNVNGLNYIYVDSNIDYGQNSGVYEEILIISSCSVEDLSIRGAFASRLAKTFQEIKDDKEITVGEFLKKFAESHGSSGQQPHYKILPSNSMFSEFLFAPHVSRLIPIINWGEKQEFDINFIPIPSF
jgi:hypothetical protein